MMNETIYIMFAFIAGLGLGTLFFGGLWLTVKKSVVSKLPAMWIFASFIFRISITMIGFYFIGAGNWRRMLACLLGFIIARFVVVYLTKQNERKEIELKKVRNHEA